MALDLSTLGDYSWTDIAKAAKHAMVTTALGGNTLSINGRTVGRITIEDAKKLFELASEQISNEQAGQNGGGNVLVNFNR